MKITILSVGILIFVLTVDAADGRRELRIGGRHQIISSGKMNEAYIVGFKKALAAQKELASLISKEQLSIDQLTDTSIKISEDTNEITIKKPSLQLHQKYIVSTQANNPKINRTGLALQLIELCATNYDAKWYSDYVAVKDDILIMQQFHLMHLYNNKRVLAQKCEELKFSTALSLSGVVASLSCIDPKSWPVTIVCLSGAILSLCAALYCANWYDKMHYRMICADYVYQQFKNQLGFRNKHVCLENDPSAFLLHAEEQNRCSDKDDLLVMYEKDEWKKVVNQWIGNHKKGTFILKKII